jgi:putative nucleotidyltransferase with HDIG domain
MLKFENSGLKAGSEWDVSSDCLDVAMIKKIKVEHTVIGMYVSQLDRPWLETPFLSHKFAITDAKQIEQLREFCTFVYIDTEKGLDLQGLKPTIPQPTATPSAAPEKDPKPTRPAAPRPISLPDAGNFRRAMAVHDQAKTVITSILNDIRIGRSINTSEAKKSVTSMIGSLLDDNNALLCLTKLKSHDEYTVSHSINVSILALAFGRHLQLNPEKLEVLGLGALLHDIGKMKIPTEVLNKPGKLTDPEFEIMKSHVLLALEVLENTSGFPPEARDVVIQHHEKLSGKGYPYGLKNGQISLFGKLLAIVDVYDAMTTDRVYRRATPPHESIKWIYEWSSKDFELELVEHFIKTIGIFPIGSQVEINRQSIGLVISNNPENAMKPSVLLLYDDQKQKYRPPRMIDLTEKDIFSNKNRWSITKVFGPMEKASFESFW